MHFLNGVVVNNYGDKIIPLFFKIKTNKQHIFLLGLIETKNGVYQACLYLVILNFSIFLIKNMCNFCDFNL